MHTVHYNTFVLLSHNNCFNKYLHFKSWNCFTKYLKFRYAEEEIISLAAFAVTEFN